jgi:hypothetical protein
MRRWILQLHALLTCYESPRQNGLTPVAADDILPVIEDPIVRRFPTISLRVGASRKVLQKHTLGSPIG